MSSSTTTFQMLTLLAFVPLEHLSFLSSTRKLMQDISMTLAMKQTWRNIRKFMISKLPWKRWRKEREFWREVPLLVLRSDIGKRTLWMESDLVVLERHTAENLLKRIEEATMLATMTQSLVNMSAGQVFFGIFFIQSVSRGFIFRYNVPTFLLLTYTGLSC
ncbi:hypothetical protein AA313_de0201948 [Arthrobotrys entomopaga]|nr:hypothetical protein AA313_de0201948 [Arthrobotrys entomopaga]